MFLGYGVPWCSALKNAACSPCGIEWPEISSNSLLRGKGLHSDDGGSWRSDQTRRRASPPPDLMRIATKAWRLDGGATAECDWAVLANHYPAYSVLHPFPPPTSPCFPHTLDTVTVTATSPSHLVATNPYIMPAESTAKAAAKTDEVGTVAVLSFYPATHFFGFPLYFSLGFRQLTNLAKTTLSAIPTPSPSTRMPRKLRSGFSPRSPRLPCPAQPF